MPGTPSAAFFASLSRELMDGEESDTLEAVVDKALEVVPGCTGAGISLRQRRGRVETVASSSALVEECDQAQYDLREGPCLDAIWEEGSYLSNDLGSDVRWPRWGPEVARRGMHAIVSVKLVGETDTLGALNMYGDRRGTYDQDGHDLALIYAAHASNALRSAHLVAGLQSAVHSRHQIGVAQGILMHRYGMSLHQSFLVLQRYSSHRNIKLRDLAQEIVDARGIPDIDDTVLRQEVI